MAWHVPGMRKKHVGCLRCGELAWAAMHPVLGTLPSRHAHTTSMHGRCHADHIRCNWKLQGITKDPAGTYTLSYETPDGNHTITTRTVALTAPAYVVADMIRSQAPGAADALASFDYPPVGAVTVAYPISAVKDERKDAAGAVPGFGQLHPRSQVCVYTGCGCVGSWVGGYGVGGTACEGWRRVAWASAADAAHGAAFTTLTPPCSQPLHPPLPQGITTLGTIYSSSLFPGRCPDGEMLLLNYIGGATNRGIVNQTHEQLVEQVGVVPPGEGGGGGVALGRIGVVGEGCGGEHGRCMGAFPFGHPFGGRVPAHQM